MNTFSSMATSFCISCVLIGALFMLCPDGTMSKPVKYIFCLVFLLTVISASGITIRSFSPEFKFENSIKENDDTLTIASAKYVYSYALTNAGINFKEIELCTNNDDSGSIIITKIIIYSNCERQKIIEALSSVASNYTIEVKNE